MIRGCLMGTLAFLIAGCASTAPRSVSVCTLLSESLSKSTFTPPAAGESSTFSIFDARLHSGFATETEDGCLVEGVAPTPAVASTQVQWIEARAGAMCGGTSQTLSRQPSPLADELGYEFAVVVSRNVNPVTCEADSQGDLLTIGGVDQNSRRMNPPRYPPRAARERLEGRTTVLIQVNPDGGVDAVLVIKSSGHPILDDAALEAVNRWQFKPSRTSNGQSVGQLIQVPINFALE